MYVHAQHGKNPAEVAKTRREAGLWLRQKREAAGLSQREIAHLAGIEYYTFVSQIESGRGRLPPDRYEQYAKALGVPGRDLALMMMRHYDPVTYRLIFEGRDEPPMEDGQPNDLESRLRRLELKLQL
jgi:transcriptional regulator with XRE-family HTH domain